MGHRMAKLTPLGRLLLVERVTVSGWSVATAAESMGVSRQTAYRWLGRFRDEGIGGLEDRSSRPARCPTRTPLDVERQVLELRRQRRWGPHRISYATGVPRSTVYRILCRYNTNRLATFDQVTRQPIRRYEYPTAGGLLHVDVKKLGRIPDGGGWRAMGKPTGRRNSNQYQIGRKRTLGHDYLHVAVDDHSRVAYVEAHHDEKGDTCAEFMARAITSFATAGVTIKRVMTDNAFAYRNSKAFQQVLTEHNITHLTTRPYRPQTNGKAERFNRTLLTEWAYNQPYTTNQQRLDDLDTFLHTYNHHRPHTALAGKPPATRLGVNNLCGNNS